VIVKLNEGGLRTVVFGPVSRCISETFTMKDE